MWPPEQKRRNRHLTNDRMKTYLIKKVRLSRVFPRQAKAKNCTGLSDPQRTNYTQALCNVSMKRPSTSGNGQLILEPYCRTSSLLRKLSEDRQFVP